MYEDFKSNTAKVVERTLEFLGVDSKVSLNTESRYNVGGKNWRAPFLKYFFMQDNYVKELFRMILPFSLRRKARTLLESMLKQKSKPINKETRENLVMFLRKMLVN